jgi:hypothetical protein
MVYKACILILTIFFLSSLVQADPIEQAKGIVACFLREAQNIAPYATLMFMLVGGVTYITAAEDNKQRLVGKKFMMMGVIGIIGVVALVALAELPPFEITVDMCGAGGGIGGGPGTGKISPGGPETTATTNAAGG